MANLPETTTKTAEQASAAISTDEAISMFEEMEPSKMVVMSRDMERIFPSVIAAMERDVSEEQIIAVLRKKWPNTHVATIVKLLNSERDRRLAQDEPIACKPFGSPRRPKTRAASKAGNAASILQAPPGTTANSHSEASQ